MADGARTTRIVIAILVLGAIATPVMGNDAGSGGDAGSTMSTALSLNATNATYYGNLSAGSDDVDLYSISMPNGTGLAVGLTSPTTGDFDPYIYDSNGSLIDYMYTTQTYEEASTNGTSVGGTTVYVKIEAYSGSGQYTMQIWIFGTGNQPGSNQNDANSGSDAASSAGSSLQLNSSNQTISGWISDTWDPQDWYNISVPTGHGIAVSMSFPNGSNFDYLYLYDSSGTQYIDYAYYSPWDVTSNGTGVGGSHVYIRVYSYYSEGDYNLTISFFSTAGQPGSAQDDAGSGTDAGDTLSMAMNLSVPISGASYDGWVDYTWDSNDYYAVEVPANWTTWASLEWNSSSDLLDLFLYSSSGSAIDSSLYDNPETVSGNGSAVSGTTVYYRVQAWTSSASSMNYTLDIHFVNLSDTPAFNQNDANSGGDAGNDFASATHLSGNGNFSQGPQSFTYFGWISDSADQVDYYAVEIPSGHAIEADLSWNNSANDFDLALYDQGQSQIDYSYYGNPESVQSGSIDVSNTTVFLVVEAYGGWSGAGEGNYTLNVTILNQSLVPGMNQNDGYSGGDAGNDYSSATPLVNASPGMSVWPGYVDSGSDDYDFYEVFVPLDHGITVEMSPGYVQSTWFLLELYDSSNSVVDYDYYSNPQSVSTNGSGVNMGGTNAVIGVTAYNGGDLYNLSIWIFSLDADGDGFYDEVEYSCGSDPFDNASVPADTDNDGICDALDEDMDGDGVDNANDTFPDDANESSDNDGDGMGDNGDYDDDNDGWNDTAEYACGSDPLDSGSVPDDLDGDGICDSTDEDIDGDGVEDADDAFPDDGTEWSDTDGDGLGDNSDTDDDGDGVEDANDFDSLDPSESNDTDGDGIGDNSDFDDDGDGWNDTLDLFPMDPKEWEDTDFDGIGDNEDSDDDDDGWLDADEAGICSTDPLDQNSVPSDLDGDRICDFLDEDDDGDGVPDLDDPFPNDPNEILDTDLDGLGNNEDSDDDGDGWPDFAEEACKTSAIDGSDYPLDSDNDGTCDLIDPDDDNDGHLDQNDLFPLDQTKWDDNSERPSGLPKIVFISSLLLTASALLLYSRRRI